MHAEQPWTDPDDTPFRRFARAHLPTAVDRAVFGVIADSETTTWTVAVVARDACVSALETDQVLRRFAAAGILERVDDKGRPRRYRWRPAMSYLRRGTSPTGSPDPVCGMPVASDSAHRAVGDDGEEMLFCSLPCLVRWRRATARRPRGLA